MLCRGHYNNFCATYADYIKSGGPYFHCKKTKKEMWLIFTLNLITSAEAISQQRSVTVETQNMTKIVKQSLLVMAMAGIDKPNT